MGWEGFRWQTVASFLTLNCSLDFPNPKLHNDCTVHPTPEVQTARRIVVLANKKLCREEFGSCAQTTPEYSLGSLSVQDLHGQS